MNILLLSLTGADDLVDPSELAKISNEFHFVEWAILFSDDREGTTRYPTKQWREEFYKAVPECNRSAHLCGKEVLGRLVAQDAALLDELKEYQRIQLNFNATRLAPELLEGLVKVVNSGICTNKSGKLIKFITQFNQANKSISYLFGQLDGHMISNHQVLFDGSGGLGKSPKTWSAPLMDKLCGYAGGLGPDNLMAELTKIKTQVEESGGIIDFHTWIDMESKIRTDDKFDLVKVRDVATTTLNYMRLVQEKRPSKVQQVKTNALDGCGSGVCIIKKPLGMHNNGGCTCSKAVFKLKIRMLEARLGRARAELYAMANVYEDSELRNKAQGIFEDLFGDS